MASAGLYRDEAQLVIDLQTHVFPDRCVMTNKEVPADGKLLVELVVGYLPLKNSGWYEGLRVASSGSAVTMQPWGNAGRFTVPLLLPLSPKWQCQRESLLANLLILGGLLSAVVSGATFGIYANADWFWERASCLALSMVIVLLGVAISPPKMSCQLVITQFEDGKIWVTGVHRDWLAALPKWQMPLVVLDHQLLMTRLAKWFFGTIAGSSALVFLLGVWLGISGFVHLKVVKTWPTVQGTIVTSGVTPQKFIAGRRGWVTTYVVAVTYSYTVEDWSFTGSTSFRYDEEKAAVDALHSLYTADGPITVRYNRANPRQAVVSFNDIEDELEAAAVFGTGGLVSGVILFWYVARIAQRQRMLEAEREERLSA